MTTHTHTVDPIARAYSYADDQCRELTSGYTSMDEALTAETELVRSYLAPDEGVHVAVYSLHTPDCHHTSVVGHECAETGECEDYCQYDSYDCSDAECQVDVVVTAEPDEPECDEAQEHEWQDGGVRGGPGLDISGRAECTRCGLVREWADLQVPGQGNQMLRYESLSYHPA